MRTLSVFRAERRAPYPRAMAYPEVMLTRLDVSPAEALSRIRGIASGLGWAGQPSNAETDCRFALPAALAGGSNVWLQVHTSPDDSGVLICELVHNFVEEEARYREAVTAAVQRMHESYCAAYRHNLAPFIEMFPVD